MDLSNYTLRSLSEIDLIRKKAGEKRFDSFKETAYNVFRSLKPGESYSVEDNVSVKNRPIFIKLACLYILQTGWECNIDIVGYDSNMIKGVITHTKFFQERAEYQIKRELIKARRK
jgi:hypothetical protein